MRKNKNIYKKLKKIYFMDFQINNIVEENIDELHTLGCSEKDFSADGGENCFWPKSTLLRLIKSDDDVTLKLIVNGEMVGFSLVMIHPVTKKQF